MEFMAILLKKSHDNIKFFISLYILDHYLNICLPESLSIVSQMHIEKRESDVWFGSSRFPCCVLSYFSLVFVMEHN